MCCSSQRRKCDVHVCRAGWSRSMEKLLVGPESIVRSWLASEHPEPGPLAFRQDWSTWKGCRRAKLTGETGRWGEARQVSSFQMVDTCLFFSLGKWQLKSSLLLVAGCCFPADFNKTCAVTRVRCWNWFHLSWVVVAFKTDKHGLGVEE